MVCLPLSINLSARHQAYSQDDIVALGLAAEGHGDLSLWPNTSCSSPKKRQRSKVEQASELSELCITPHGHQPGRHSVGGHTATACSLQRDRPIARSSWPGMLRLNSCSMREQPSSCNSSMCSSQTSSMTPSCSSPTSQTSSMAPYDSSSCYEQQSSSVTHSTVSVMSACMALSESSSSSCWSSTAGLLSIAGPGADLGEGNRWILSQYGGREALAEYEFGPTLGCGTFGITRLVSHRLTGRPSACKTICKATLSSSPAAISDVQHEVAILQHLSGHSGIVQLQGVYEDERNIHLVMELCTGGDLLDYISRFGRLAEAEAADVARVMLKTLQHCHKLGVVHRDIKPENFLLGAPTMLLSPAGSAAAALKISDFGVSAFYHPGQNFSEIVGTPFYMAPEVLERNYGPAADIWSVGVVVFLMVAGCLPFNGNTDRQIIKAVLDSDPDFNSIAWQGVSPEAKHFVQQMLVKDPSKRTSIQQLLKHPWLGGNGSNRNGNCCSNSSSSQCSDQMLTAAEAGGRQQGRGSEAAADSQRGNRTISCPGKWWSAGAPTVMTNSSSSSSSSYPGCLPCDDHQDSSTTPPATPPLVVRPLARQTSVQSRFQPPHGDSP